LTPSRTLSFVVPLFNEEDTIAELVDRIRANSTAFALELLLIDDGSTDRSGQVCDRLAAKYTEVQSIHLGRNHGKTTALAKGFARATGDIVFTIDADLQDDPAEIPRFIEAIDAGYDLVTGWKAERKDPWQKRIASKVYNGFTARVFGLKLHDMNCGFKAMRRDVAKSLDLKHDYHRVIPVLAVANGYRVTEIPVKHHARQHGSSKYGFERYWKGLRDVWRVYWEIKRRR